MIYCDTLLSHRTGLLPGQSSRCRQARCPGRCCTRPAPAQAAVVRVWWWMPINGGDHDDDHDCDDDDHDDGGGDAKIVQHDVLLLKKTLRETLYR